MTERLLLIISHEVREGDTWSRVCVEVEGRTNKVRCTQFHNTMIYLCSSFRYILKLKLLPQRFKGETADDVMESHFFLDLYFARFL